MYDWNGNGKHDSFDDAMFMALLEDDLERHPQKKSTKKNTKKNTTATASGGDFMITLLIGGLFMVFFMCIVYGQALLGIALIVIAMGVALLVTGDSSGSSSSVSATTPKYQPTNNERIRERMKTIQQQTTYGKIIKTYDKTLVFQLTERWKKLGEACLYYCNYEKEYYIQKVDFAKIGACQVYWAGRVEKSYAKPDFKIPHVEKVPNNGLVIYPDDMREPLVIEMYDTEEVYKIVLFIIQHPELWGKDTAWETILELEAFGITKPDSKTDVKAAPKPEVKPESKPASTPARRTHSPSYTSGYIPVYTPSYTSSSISDDEPEETVRERLDYDLIGTGYDSYDLEWMDEDERNQVLEDNFLDPYDYDFDDLD